MVAHTVFEGNVKKCFLVAFLLVNSSFNNEVSPDNDVAHNKISYIRFTYAKGSQISFTKKS